MYARRWFFLILFAVLAMAFAPAPFEKRQRGNKKPGNEIEGVWERSSERIEVTPTRLIYHPHLPSRIEYALKFNSNANPQTYDLDGIPDKSSAGRTYRGIYKIEGDTLTLCYNGGTTRPAAFNQGGITEVFKRLKR